jgi:membrane-associated protease RseP (regulator of RpoE activity)
VKEFLSQRGVTWTEKYVDNDRAAAIEMVRRSGQTGVPVTVIGDEVVVGFDRMRLERILAARSRAGVAQDAKPGRKPLGAKVADAGRYALPGGTAVEGAYVGGVTLGSPAELAGLRAGDVITAVGGKAIRSVDELAAALNALSPTGGPTTLTLARGTATREVRVQL